MGFLYSFGFFISAILEVRYQLHYDYLIRQDLHGDKSGDTTRRDEDGQCSSHAFSEVWRTNKMIT